MIKNLVAIFKAPTTFYFRRAQDKEKDFVQGFLTFIDRSHFFIYFALALFTFLLISQNFKKIKTKILSQLPLLHPLHSYTHSHSFTNSIPQDKYINTPLIKKVTEFIKRVIKWVWLYIFIEFGREYKGCGGGGGSVFYLGTTKRRDVGV